MQFAGCTLLRTEHHGHDEAVAQAQQLGISRHRLGHHCANTTTEKAAMSQKESVSNAPTPEEFLAMSQTEEFSSLRRTFRGFAFPVTVGFLAWYLFYIITATFAVDFVETRVFGAINVGMVLGLAQFATAGLITWAYVSFADNKIDPATESIRSKMEDPRRNMEVTR